MFVKEITAPNKLQPHRISQSDPEQPGTRQNNIHVQQLRTTSNNLEQPKPNSEQAERSPILRFSAERSQHVGS